MYPNIRIFLQILITLPVSAATAERSTLKRLKTWLRNRTSVNWFSTHQCAS
nr:MAG: hypothetical protein DiTV3a_F7ORF1 [Diabrotica toursvirus 3a]